MSTINPAAVKAWLLDLQARIVQSLEDVDGKPFTIDADGLLVMLSGVEFTLLKALVENAQEVLSRDKMLSICYARDIGERAIDLQVSRLRHKLRDETRASSLIKTVRGEGYVFATRVEFQ